MSIVHRLDQAVRKQHDRLFHDAQQFAQLQVPCRPRWTVLFDETVDWERSLVKNGHAKLTAPVVGTSEVDRTTITAATYLGRVVLLDSTGDILADHHHDEEIYVSPQFVDRTGDGSEDLLVMDGSGRLLALTE